MDAAVVREVRDPKDPAIAAFGRLQERVYPEPESLIPAGYLPMLVGTGSDGRRNFLIVAERAGEVVGGAVFHYFAKPNTGFSSFLGVAREARGEGVARRLHEARFSVLDAAAGGRVEGVFIDVVAPERLSQRALEREGAVGSDPVSRRRAFQSLGFRRVAVRYEQPVGGPGGGPITTMDLLYCPREPAATVDTDLVVETMREYWGGWLGRSADRHAAELRRWAGGDSLALEPAAP